MPAPSTANITVILGGTRNITVNHRNFSNLTMKRQPGDVCNSFTLSVLDEATFEIEASILSGNNDIKVIYEDKSENVNKEFNGSIIKMDTSFVDNRCMLTIDGFIGVTTKDKYAKYSHAWNVVPKFDWDEIFSNAGIYDIDVNLDENDTWGMLWGSLKLLWYQDLSWRKMLGASLYSLISGNKIDFTPALEMLTRIVQNDEIYCDEGGYYILSEKYLSQNDSTEDRKVYSSGSWVVPMKPSAIVRLIAEGGSFSTLLMENYEDYKGTAFYDDNNDYDNLQYDYNYTDEEIQQMKDNDKQENLKILDWLFISEFFKKKGTHPGRGWKIGEIEETDYVEDDLAQVKESDIEYINKSLTERSVITKVDSEGTKTTYANFYATFDNDKFYYKRLDATKLMSAKPAATYTYYGKFEENGNGRLVAFNATTNILTAQITSNLNENDEESDLSTMNLITGGTTEITVTKSNVLSEEEIDKKKMSLWESVEYSPTIPTAKSSNSGSNYVYLANMWEKAQQQCYKAEATILGSHNLKPLDTIEIIVVPNSTNGVTSGRHHTSGRYYVMGIEETIDGGAITSKLSLIKNIGDMADTQIKSRVTAKPAGYSQPLF